MVTLSRGLSEGVSILKNNGIESSRLDAELIMGKVLKIDRLKVMTCGSMEIDDEKYLEYLRLIDLRKNGMPTAYILGVKEFMGLQFIVAPGVLIPRGDTEVSVEQVIEECRKYSRSVEIADVGCGSGAIGVSAAAYAKNAAVTMIDIDDNAIRIASQNILLNKVKDRVSVLKGNLLDPVKDRKFYIIVSNPPYIRSDVIPSLQKEVRDFEPRIALDGGEDGLTFYRRLTPMAFKCLHGGGKLIYEIGYDQAEDVKTIMEDAGFFDIAVFKDLAGLNRCIVGKKVLDC